MYNTQVINTDYPGVLDTAARRCTDYLSVGGHTGWYLPARQELHGFYPYLAARGIGGFRAVAYASSTEVSALRIARARPGAATLW